MKLALTVALGFGLLASACVPKHWVAKNSTLMTAEERLALARLYAEDKQYPAAIRECETVLRKDPKNHATLLLLGDLYVATKQWRRAEKVYRKALAQNRHDARVLNNLAMVWLEQSVRLKRAEKFALQALALDQALEPFVLDTLIHIYLKECRAESAFPYLDRYETLASQIGGALNDRARGVREGFLRCASQQNSSAS